MIYSSRDAPRPSTGIRRRGPCRTNVRQTLRLHLFPDYIFHRGRGPSEDKYQLGHGRQARRPTLIESQGASRYRMRVALFNLEHQNYKVATGITKFNFTYIYLTIYYLFIHITDYLVTYWLLPITCYLLPIFISP